MRPTTIYHDTHSFFIRIGGCVFRPVDASITPKVAHTSFYVTMATTAFVPGQQITARPWRGETLCLLKSVDRARTELWQSHGRYLSDRRKRKRSDLCWNPAPQALGRDIRSAAMVFGAEASQFPILTAAAWRETWIVAGVGNLRGWHSSLERLIELILPLVEQDIGAPSPLPSQSAGMLRDLLTAALASDAARAPGWKATTYSLLEQARAPAAGFAPLRRAVNAAYDAYIRLAAR